MCASVNEQIVHGFPNNRPLQEGDILSLDFGVLYEGYYGDAAITLPVGEISSAAANLLKVTEESLYRAIEEARADNRLSDISHAVQKHVEAAGFSVVRQFVGHGIGRELHEDPQVPEFRPARDGSQAETGHGTGHRAHGERGRL